MCKEHQTTLVDFVPGRCTGITQPYDASVQAPCQLTFLEDVVMSTLTQIDKHAKRIIIDDRIPILCNTSVWQIWPASQALKKMEMVQEVSCQHLRTAEDNTYLQVDMQANIFRSRTHHFVHMQVWKMVKTMAFTCTTTTRASWIDAMGHESLTYWMWPMHSK